MPNGILWGSMVFATMPSPYSALSYLQLMAGCLPPSGGFLWFRGLWSDLNLLLGLQSGFPRCFGRM